MSSSVIRNDFHTHPDAGIFSDAATYHKFSYPIKIVNTGARRIGWAIKTMDSNRLGVEPSCGVLDPNEYTFVMVSCDFTVESSCEDQIIIEWTNAPDWAKKQFCRGWFQSDGILRRKNLPIEYNPESAPFVVYSVFLTRVP